MSELTYQLIVNEPIQGKTDIEIMDIPITIEVIDGNPVIVCTYRDTVWSLPNSMFPNSSPMGKRKINFDLVPEKFQPIFKEIVYLYMTENLEGKRRPRGTTLFDHANLMSRFLKFIGDNHKKVNDLSEISTIQIMDYVTHVQSMKLSATFKTRLFWTVELLYHLSQKTNQKIRKHPWPESSPHILSGFYKQDRNKAKTEVIPDEVLQKLFREAVKLIDQSDALFQLRTRFEQLESQHRTPSGGILYYRVQEIIQKETDLVTTKGELLKKLHLLRSACYILIATTTGCRVHEISYLRNNCIRIEEVNDEIYYWMQAKSTKTYAGETEWLIPEIGVKAITALEGWAKPYQRLLQKQIEELENNDPLNPTIAELKQTQGYLFLRKSSNHNNQIGVLTLNKQIQYLKEFAEYFGINWNLSTHQFRRSFAVYAARSAFGNLIMLKEHFKHYSLDMSALYYLNEKQEEELFGEVFQEMQHLKEGYLTDLLDPEIKLSGGAASNFYEVRKNNEIKTYKNRKELVEKTSHLVSLRATGHGWCLAEGNGCSGQGLIEKTRCVDCDNGLIDNKNHVAIWKGIYDQQIELRRLDDIGRSGIERVERDILQCERVLQDLGIEIRQGNNHG